MFYHVVICFSRGPKKIVLKILGIFCISQKTHPHGEIEGASNRGEISGIDEASIEIAADLMAEADIGRPDWPYASVTGTTSKCSLKTRCRL